RPPGAERGAADEAGEGRRRLPRRALHRDSRHAAMSDDEVRETPRFAKDSVTRFSPVTFAIAFVSAMRKRKELSHVPSVRTAVAVPRFLTARYFRLGALSARDYVEA